MLLVPHAFHASMTEVSISTRTEDGGDYILLVLAHGMNNQWTEGSTKELMDERRTVSR